jgi:hypothetical protein
MDDSRSVSRDLDTASTDDGGAEEEEEDGRTKTCTECKVVKASTEVCHRPHMFCRLSRVQFHELGSQGALARTPHKPVIGVVSLFLVL